MGRRASKAGREVAGPAEIDSVGLTILPGHPLPAWAGGEELAAPDPTGAPTDAGTWPDGTAWGAPPAWDAEASVLGAAGPADTQAFEAQAPDGRAAQVPAQAPVGALDPAWPAAVAAAAHAEQPMPAMVSAGAPAWSTAGTAQPPGVPAGAMSAAATASGFDPPAFGAPGSPSGLPGGPMGSPTAMGLPGGSASYPGGAGLPSAPGGYPTNPGLPGAPAGFASAPGAPTLPGPREAHAPAMSAAGRTATAWPEAPTAPAPAAPHTGPMQAGMTHAGPAPMAAGTVPAGHHGPAAPVPPGGAPAAPQATPPTHSPVATDAAPSDVWTSQQRPELTPEHVALLTWWAEMISKGQFPGPVPAAAAPPRTKVRRGFGRRTAAQPTAGPVAGTLAAATPPGSPAVPAGPAVSAPSTGSAPAVRRGRRRVLVGVAAGVCAVALVGAAVVVGPSLLGADAASPAAVPATDLVMPASVGDLVPLASGTAGEALNPVLGLGLRPSGVTVTQAYGTSPDGPMVLGALASTAPIRTDAVGQILTWEQSAGATVGESVTGSGTTAGITCAPVSALPSAPTGSLCIWGDQVLRGQTYAVGADPEAALALTAQLRSGVSPAQQP